MRGAVMKGRALAAVAVIVASCALPDDFVKVDPAGTAGTGGSDGGGGSGGIPCSDAPQNSCSGGLVRQYGGAGLITVTDMAFAGSGVVSVGTFSGTVDFGGPQLSAGGAAQGFAVLHDAAGDFAAQVALPEATADSVLAVTYRADANQFAVGGTYGSGSACGRQGVFIRRLVVNGAALEDVHAPVCVEALATALEVGGIAMTEAGGVSLAGTVNGTLDTLTSEASDGFMFSIDMAGGTPEVFLAGGSGDAAIRGILPNETDVNQWLIAGDFSGELLITFPGMAGQVTETRTAEGSRDLFVAAIDRFFDAPNLDVRAMGSASGNHRLVTLADNPDVLGGMYLAAMIEGALDVGETVSAEARPSAMILSFGAPDDGANQYTYVDHYVISADQLDVRDMVGATGRIHLGGHASGDLAITRAGEQPFTYPGAQACLFDAFILVLTPGESSTDARRCGDGSQVLHAIARYTDTLFALSLTVPAGASIDLGEGIVSEPAQRTYLLREP
jgi:hypothetical protein